jgi:hypothetical protein
MDSTNGPDKAFLEKVSPHLGGKTYLIDPPKLSAEARMIRRLTHRNEHQLYHRKCDLTGEMIISVYSADKPFKVYKQSEWWGDRWDGLDHGREFDFNRSFFSQFAELQLEVPRMSLLQSQNENSDYSNCVSNLKDCYLLFSSDYNRDCYYGTWMQQCTDSLDSYLIDSCELTHDSIFSNKIYGSSFVLFSSQCADSSFLMDCQNVKNSFMCTNLRNKEYCIKNEQYTKEEYEYHMSTIDLGSHEQREAFKQEFLVMVEEAKHQYMHRNGRIEDSTGDFLMNVKDATNCFELVEVRDAKNVHSAWQANDVQDSCYVNRELGYENCECFPMPTRSAFNLNSYDGNDVYYSDLCMNSSYLFGCIGLKREKYCILNKQYTQEEYEALVPRIIEHMKSTGEWGEFFPTQLSPFAYNETNAQDYFPLTKEESLAKDYSWKEDDESSDYQGPIYEIPDNIKDVPDNIVDKILKCEVSGKLYKIIPQELAFYRKMGWPLSRKAPHQRYLERIALKNPRKLWERDCLCDEVGHEHEGQCGDSFETTYSPERAEKVYCESCYLKAIY